MKKGTGRKPKEPIHKASVDDYDKKSQEKEESIVYPLITYDPGLLDLALIIVTLSRTQTIMVLLCAECNVGHAANPLPAAPADGAVGSAHSPSIARTALRHLPPRGQALLADRGASPGDDGAARRRSCLLLLAAHTALFGPAVLRPSLLLCDEFDAYQLDCLLTEAICGQKPRLQQSLWKLFVRHVRLVQHAQA